ncbi:hypothetical protein OKW34_000078 [Paraburkholderia youngii]|uniref:hypothetical protein n=1 Tax=Paraburkholderia youngii TaxID=2782701 RepID=UPI003D194559
MTDNVDQENTLDLQAPKVVVNAPSTLDMKSRDITCFARDSFGARARNVNFVGEAGEVTIDSEKGVHIGSDRVSIIASGGPVSIAGTDKVCIKGKLIRLG